MTMVEDLGTTVGGVHGGVYSNLGTPKPKCRNLHVLFSSAPG